MIEVRNIMGLMFVLQTDFAPQISVSL